MPISKNGTYGNLLFMVIFFISNATIVNKNIANKLKNTIYIIDKSPINSAVIVRSITSPFPNPPLEINEVKYVIAPVIKAHTNDETITPVLNERHANIIPTTNIAISILLLICFSLMSSYVKNPKNPIKAIHFII